eukprot:gene9973-20785_t
MAAVPAACGGGAHDLTSVLCDALVAAYGAGNPKG